MTKQTIEQLIEELPCDLPDGELIPPRRGGYFLGDPPVQPGLRTRIRELHPASGLWPVFLNGHEEIEKDTWPKYGLPQTSRSAPPDARSADSLLAARWAQVVDLDGFPIEEHARILSEIAPFDESWPGLAPAGDPTEYADAIADELAERLFNDPGTGLAVFQLRRGADVPWAAGWFAGEDISPTQVSALLRSWEDRFGARLLRLGRSSLVVSIASPPSDLPHAQRVAAEHYAFCPKGFSPGAGSLMRYAEELVGVSYWSFWWDREPVDDVEE